MTAREQVQSVQQQLGAALLRKEVLTGELAGINEQINAFRNVLEGVQLGQDALRAAAQEQAAKEAKDAAELLALKAAAEPLDKAAE